MHEPPTASQPRSDVLRFLAEIGQPFVLDQTNDHLHVTRNRLRHDLLPKLADYNPQVRDALMRLARQAAECEEVVAALADGLLAAALVESGPSSCKIETCVLAGRHRHLLRACFVRLWQRQGWPLQAMTYDHWDRLAGLVLEGDSPKAVTLPARIDARRRGRHVVLSVPADTCCTSGESQISDDHNA